MAIAYDIRDSGGRHAQEPAQSREQLEADLELHRKWMRRISDACERVAHGDLEVRLLGCDAGGDIQRAARGLNHLLDVTDAFVREAGDDAESSPHAPPPPAKPAAPPL